MEQYIKKSALVAEIKIRIETYNKGYANGDDCRADALETFLHDIDSLEVKEAKEDSVNEDLEEAAEEYAPDFSNSIASKAAVDAVRDAFKAGAQWQALHSLETIKGMEEQAFLAGVEAEQTYKSFSKEELEELLNKRINKL